MMNNTLVAGMKECSESGTKLDSYEIKQQVYVSYPSNLCELLKLRYVEQSKQALIPFHKWTLSFYTFPQMDSERSYHPAHGQCKASEEGR
jgi:hypothetical protein